jgi:hypothetical protein
MLSLCFHLSGFEQSDRLSRNLDLIQLDRIPEPRVFKLPAVCTPSRNMENAITYNRGVTPVLLYESWNDVRKQIFEESASFVKVIILYYVKIPLLHAIVLIGFKL